MEQNLKEAILEHSIGNSEPSQEGIQENNIVVIPKHPVDPANNEVVVMAEEQCKYAEAIEEDVWQQDRAVIVVPKENIAPVKLEVPEDLLAQYKQAIEMDVWNADMPDVIVFSKEATSSELVVPKVQARQYERICEDDVWQMSSKLDEHLSVAQSIQKAPKPLSPARERYNEILQKSFTQNNTQPPNELRNCRGLTHKAVKNTQKLPPISVKKEDEIVTSNGTDFVKRYNQALMQYEELEITDDNKTATRAKKVVTEHICATSAPLQRRSPQQRANTTTRENTQYHYLSVGKLVKEIISQRPRRAEKVDELVGDL